MAERIFIAGHRGLVGSALTRRLQTQQGYELLLASRSELDLRDTSAVEAYFEANRPSQVIIAAAKVGGILANASYPVDFLLDNLRIQNNLIASSHRFGVRKLLFLGSSCVYPKLAQQPIRESSLLEGPLEPTNEAYAIAKIAGIKLVQAFRKQYGCGFITAMPTNLYGPGDNFSLASSHVVPALMRRFHEAKKNQVAEVTLWGTGSPLREFVHVDDLAEACQMLLEKYDSADIINIGAGEEVSIRELAELMRTIVGYTGAIRWDTSKPDGTPRKLLDAQRITQMGWKPRIGLEEGLRATYAWFIQHAPGAA